MFIALLWVFSCEHCSLRLSVNHRKYRVMPRMTNKQENKFLSRWDKSYQECFHQEDKIRNSRGMWETWFGYAKGVWRKGIADDTVSPSRKHAFGSRSEFRRILQLWECGRDFYCIEYDTKFSPLQGKHHYDLHGDSSFLLNFSGLEDRNVFSPNLTPKWEFRNRDWLIHDLLNLNTVSGGFNNLRQSFLFSCNLPQLKCKFLSCTHGKFYTG